MPAQEHLARCFYKIPSSPLLLRSLTLGAQYISAWQVLVTASFTVSVVCQLLVNERWHSNSNIDMHKMRTLMQNSRHFLPAPLGIL